MKSQQVNCSVREERSFQSDQGALWHAISNKAKRHDAPSPSMNISEIYEKEKFGLGEYEAGFNKTVSQIGAVFLI